MELRPADPVAPVDWVCQPVPLCVDFCLRSGHQPVQALQQCGKTGQSPCSMSAVLTEAPVPAPKKPVDPPSSGISMYRANR
jgi:hypothetical protein